jgi:hypothetical protein
MWNKKLNHWLWVKVKTGSRMGWGFPFLLPVLQETLEELDELLGLAKPLLKGAKPPLGAVLDISRAGLEMLREVRRLGPCRLVEVQKEDVRVSVRLI